MRRSMVIASAVVCALGTAGLASAQSVGFDRFGFEIRLGGGGGGSFHTAREVERAEARLHGARRAHQDAIWKLDSVLARQQVLVRDLAAVERRIAEHRGTEHELRRLHEQLDVAQRDARSIESDLARLHSLVADARRAGDEARDAHFRRADESSLVIDARRRVETSQQELDGARRWVLEQQLYPSLEWQRAAGWRDDIARRLADAERDRVPAYEIERLRRDLAEAERRLEPMVDEALLRDPTVRANESRLADAQRRFDEAWAHVERDLEHDRDFRRARDDAARFSADAARADKALYGVREQIARLEHEIDRLRQACYGVDIREMERRAGAIRHELDFVGRDFHAARQCLTQAELELRNAQFAYDAAYAAHQRCLAEERHSVSIRVEHRDSPRHDRRGGHDDEDRDNRRGGYDRGSDDRGGDVRRSGGDDRRGGDDHRRDDDDRDDRARRTGGGSDDSVARASNDERTRASGGDDRRASAASSGGGGPGAASAPGSSTGTYRDRGDRYERARGADNASRQRTRE